MDESVYEKYRSSSIEELLQDDEFITALLRNAGQADSAEHANVRNIELAQYFVDSVQVKNEPVSSLEVQKMWKNIVKLNSVRRRAKVRRSIGLAGIAASIAAAVILTLAFNRHAEAGESLAAKMSTVKAPEAVSDDIRLIIQDNDVLSLEGQEVELAYNSDGLSVNNGSLTLAYRRPSASNATDDINQLIVPFGKRSKIRLMDGTQIWVNAGSRIIYPTVFDKMREIYVDGEAYLEVSHDEKRPFVVHTKNMDVEVIGTHFNVMAYEKDSVQSIMLASGSVRVKAGQGGKVAVLKPSELFSTSRGETRISKVDVDSYIAWMSGMYVFSGEKLDLIFGRLSRYYGMEIDCSPDVAQLRCSGKLDLKNNLQDVLKAISRTAPISFHRKANSYIITNKGKEANAE